MQVMHLNGEFGLYRTAILFINTCMGNSTPNKQVNKNASVQSKSAAFNAHLHAVGRDGDKAAFVELFEYFAPRIKSYLMKNGTSPDQADELAQEAMLSVWHKAATFDSSQASASTWIFTIARNKRIDAIRKASRPDPDANDPLMKMTSFEEPHEGLEHYQEEEKITRIMEKLPQEQAVLIVKSFFEGKAHAEIAEETGLPLGTVKSRIRLALERLRKEMEDKDAWL